MKINFKHCIGILAVAAGISLAGQAAAAPFFQDHDRDYSKTKTYQQGMREGKDDAAHKKDHSRKRTFKKDEDQKAYESGYQQGHDNR